MIPFLDLTRQYLELRTPVREALDGVLERGRFVLGEEVSAFEREFAEYLGAGHCVGLASGTDAITLVLKALGAGEGDEVITTPFTAIPTVMAVRLSGARPVFADIEEVGYGLDSGEAARVVSERTRAILPVHLFGRCLDLEGLGSLARERGVYLLEDACQAHGARRGTKAAGTFGVAGAFSFYPTKNLGAYGDGGAVATDDAVLAERLRRLRDYGRSGRDLFEEVGYNSRLDELQAAVLRVKLRHLDAWNSRRRELAALYGEMLAGLPVTMPSEDCEGSHVFHLYVIAADDRDGLAAFLGEEGIQTHVHYPVPAHLQPAFADLGYGRGDFPRAEAAASTVLSLPMSPWLTDDEARTVARGVRSYYENFPPP